MGNVYIDEAEGEGGGGGGVWQLLSSFPYPSEYYPVCVWIMVSQVMGSRPILNLLKSTPLKYIPSLIYRTEMAAILLSYTGDIFVCIQFCPVA